MTTVKQARWRAVRHAAAWLFALVALVLLARWALDAYLADFDLSDIP
jgi:hypothetical protein